MILKLFWMKMTFLSILEYHRPWVGSGSRQIHPGESMGRPLVYAPKFFPEAQRQVRGNCEAGCAHFHLELPEGSLRARPRRSAAWLLAQVAVPWHTLPLPPGAAGGELACPAAALRCVATSASCRALAHAPTSTAGRIDNARGFYAMQLVRILMLFLKISRKSREIHAKHENKLKIVLKIIQKCTVQTEHPSTLKCLQHNDCHP